MKRILLIISMCLAVFAIPFGAFAGEDDFNKYIPGETYTYEENGQTHIQKVKDTFSFVEGNIAYKIVGNEEEHNVEVAEWAVVWACTESSHDHSPGAAVGVSSEYSNINGNITIPATIDHDGKQYNVIGIGANAFVNVEAKEIKIPESITYINNSAFYGYKNVSNYTLHIPANVAVIGESAFKGCNVPIAFDKNSKLKTIETNAFNQYSGSTEALVLPQGLETIERNAFGNCTFASITIPNTVTNIDVNSLSAYSWGNYIFSSGEPANFVKQDGVLSGNGQIIKVYDNTVTSISLPEGVSTIGANAFSNCENLTSITLPSSLTSIDSYAFYGCTKLTSVVGSGNIVTFGSGAFQNCSSLANIDLSSAETIGNSAFSGCTALKVEQWPNALSSLGNSSFKQCVSLESIEIKGPIKEIPTAAFSGCYSVKIVNLPEGLETISQSAFNFAANNNQDRVLEYINIPSTVTSIGNTFLSGVQNQKTVLVFQGDTPPVFSTSALSQISGAGKNAPVIYFPANAADDYTKADGALVNAGLVTAPQEGETPSNSYSLEVTAPTTTLYSGDQLALDVISTIPSDGELRAESSNPDVAQVTVQDGKVTVKSLSKGSATITLSIYDRNGILLISKTVDLTFSEPPYTGKYSYEISVAQPDNGRVSVDKYATEGDTVTITVTPDEGYVLDALTATVGGKELDVTDHGDGTYSFTMPSGKVSITAAFVEAPEEPAADVSDLFIDVAADAWYTDAVQYAYDNGLMTGTSATTFEPNTATSRGMIVAMLHRLEGSPAAGSADFSDVASGDWYADAVAWAASEGIVGGFEDGTFLPNEPITREQMASILYRYAEYKGLAVSARASFDAYSDADSVSPWASDVLSWAVAEGLITGMTEDTLAPQGETTRAQTAAIFQRFLENVM